MLVPMVQAIPIKADNTNNLEHNTTSISLDKQYYGNMTSSIHKRYYKFTLSSSGKISIIANSTITQTSYSIYDKNGTELWSDFYYSDDITNTSSINETFDLTSGTYYLLVDSNDYQGNYNFHISYKNAEESFRETGNGNDNSIATSNKISLGNTYNGQLALNDEKDIFKFVLPSSGRIKLNIKLAMYKMYCSIYDDRGNNVWNEYIFKDDIHKQSFINKNIDLTSGTYYLAISKEFDFTGTYSFKMFFENAKESFRESHNGNNNSIHDANNIKIGATYKGQLAVNDDTDFYKLTLKSSKKITLDFKSNVDYIGIHLYDHKGNIVWETYNIHDIINTDSIKESIKLSAGIYYFAVDRLKDFGPYMFTFYNGRPISSAKIKFNTTVYTYNGHNRKPQVSIKYNSKTLRNKKDYIVSYSNNKYVGNAKVKIIGRGKYSGNITKTFLIIPKSTKIKKIQKRKSKIILTISPQRVQATGYEIQYSTNKQFRNSKKSSISSKYKKIILKTSKGKYYIRIRTYKKKGKKKYFSNWSAVKSVRIK